MRLSLELADGSSQHHLHQLQARRIMWPEQNCFACSLGPVKTSFLLQAPCEGLPLGHLVYGLDGLS